MPPRISVLEVITAFGNEAPAQSAAVLAKYLDPKKFDVTAVSLRSITAPSMTIDDLERAGVAHVSMGMGGFFDLAGVVRLTKFILRYRPDVVHSHAFRADLWCGLAAKAAGVPLIVSTMRNHDRHVLKMEHSFLVGRLAAAASWFATSLADQVVAVSEGIAEYLVGEHGVPVSKVRVIHNGFDFDRLDGARADRALVRRQLGWQDDDVVIGTLAVLKPRKGLRYLIQAAHSVLAVHKNARFFVAGEGPQRELLDQEVARLGLSDRFHLLGQREDPLALLAASDIYALPSEYEGLSRSLLEAMALGIPAVATDIGGNREVVQHELSGLMVPPRDAARLGDAISRLVASVDLRRMFGDAAERTIRQQFDARRTATAHEQIYLRVGRT